MTKRRQKASFLIEKSLKIMRIIRKNPRFDKIIKKILKFDNFNNIIRVTMIKGGIGEMHHHLIEFKNVSKTFNTTEALSNINLYVDENEFLTLLGPSGCGKSTLLRLIAGFELPTEGQLFFEGQDLTVIPPYKRKVNTVFQKYALFPHLNVYDNIAFGMRIQKKSDKEIEYEVGRVLELVNLKGFDKRSVDSLSGGQQQRIAIARAIVNKPHVLLLDEPLAALDLKLRKDMQIELKNMQRELGVTFIYVTHDQEEALSMSDTIVVMNEGKIQQIGAPCDIYNEPKNAFVADFIGESNIIDGVMLENYKAKFSGHTFQCLDKGFAEGEPVDVVVRPEDVDIVPVESGMLSGEVTQVTFMGVHNEIIVDIGGFKWMIQTTDSVNVGERIGISLDPDAIHIMKKSEYSGMFGDYSSYSNELDELSDPGREE